MLFLIYNNEDIIVADRRFIWKAYILVKVLLTIKWIKIINKKDIAKAALDENMKVFIVYVAYLYTKILIY